VLTRFVIKNKISVHYTLRNFESIHSSTFYSSVNNGFNIGRGLSSEFKFNMRFRQGDAVASLISCWRLQLEDRR
jgi:hypothetical protein